LQINQNPYPPADVLENLMVDSVADLRGVVLVPQTGHLAQLEGA
jgi:hypothetical protein